MDDNFNTLDTKTWKCEYQCPQVSGSFARFSILSDNPSNTNQTWSKIASLQKYGYGSYAMTFRYNRIPLEAPVWAGFALVDDSGNEINYGYSPMNTNNGREIYMEYYKNGKEIASDKVDTGINLYDGNWHTGIIVVSADKISLSIDGKPVHDIISNVPGNVFMPMIPGARLVSGKLSSEFHMDVDRIIAIEKNLEAEALRQVQQLITQMQVEMHKQAIVS